VRVDSSRPYAKLISKLWRFVPFFLAAHVRDPRIEIVSEELLSIHKVKAEVVEAVSLRHDGPHILVDQVILGIF